MDTNLDIYEPLKLAGSTVTSSVNIVSPKTTSTEDVGLFQDELFPNNEELQESCGTVEKLESVEELWSYGEMLEEVEEEEEEEEDVEEEEVESLIDWPSCGSPESSISETDKTGWATFKLAANPWDDEKKPVFNVLNYNEIELNEDEACGILSDRIVAACSTFLDRNPESKGYCVAKLQLKEKGLKDITILEAHRYLQYIDLSWNCLTDLYPLSGIPYLMYLNVSNNNLTSVLRFKAPWNLTYVDYSYNNVETIDDLTDFWSLEYLDLSHNKITKIEGLQNLRYLTGLDLSFNKIKVLENLSNLRIQNLNIESNEISSFEEGPDIGLKTMLYLHYINISSNQLTSLALFKGVYHVRIVQVQNNQIADLMETSHLKTMHLLQELDLTKNPLTQWDKYREVICYTIPSLCYLDETYVRTLEKVAADNLFAPGTIFTAARDHARLVLLEDLNQPSLELDTLPIDQGPYPLVVLVGPPGSGKAYFISELVSHFPNKIHSGVCHTTRNKEPEEEDGLDYHFVSQEKFNELTRNGMFLCVKEFLGASYGLSRMEVAKAVEDKKLCVTHMDLVSALTLNNRGIQPHLVLVILEGEDRHLDRLREKYEAVTYDDPSCSSGAVSIQKKSTSTSGKDSQVHSRSATNIAGNILESLLWEKVCTSLTEMNLSFKPESHSEIQTANKQSPSNDSTENKPTLKTVRMAVFGDSDKLVLDNNSHTTYSNQAVTNAETTKVEKDVPKTPVPHVTIELESDFYTGIKNDNSFPVPMPMDKGRQTKQVFSCSEIINTVWYDNLPLMTSEDGMASGHEPSESEGNMETQCLNASEELAHTSFKSTFECSSLYSSLVSTNDPDENCNQRNAEVMPKMSEVKILWHKEMDNSDVSISSLENVQKLYIRSILQTRDSYFKVHLENPGLFSETVYSDDVNKGFRKLYKHIRETFISRPMQRPIFKFEDDPAYKLMIPRRLEILSQDIYRGHSTMEKQIDAVPKADLLHPIQQRSNYKIVGDMENVAPKLHSRKCNLPY